MEISDEKFEDSLRKISPEMADTMKLLFNVARRELMQAIASPLIDAKDNGQFDATLNNLQAVRRFIVEEAEKLSNDKAKSEVIVKDYFNLLEEIANAREYLFMKNFGKTTDDMGVKIREIRENADKMADEIGIEEPSKEEVDEVLRKMK